MYLWLKAWHIIAMVAWFAGLFYGPRLLVYHVEATDTLSVARFKIMEWRLYYAIMWPSAIATTILGLGLLSLQWNYYLQAPWMHAKLLAVVLLWGYHLSFGHFVKKFANNHNQHSSKFYRVFNEIPTLLLIVIVCLVVIRP